MASEQKLGSGDVADSLALPKVSVVIPCFNQAHYLAESISSALDAYDGPLEIIVVDDGSTDPRTALHLNAAKRLSPAVRVISQPNAGLSGARNTGIAAATGEFVQLLDADDVIVPPKLDLQVAHFKIACNLDVSVSNFLLCDASRTVFSKHDEAIAHSNFSLTDFLYKWERGFAIPIHCALFRRSSLPEQPFDTSARAKEDWLFWCGLSANGARMAYVNIHNAIYRQHEQSMRRSYVKMGKSWLHAASKIDQFVSAREPAFFESAVDWFENFYRRHPAYVEEIASLRAAPKRVEENVSSLSVKSGLTPEQSIANIDRVMQTMSSDTPFVSVIVPVYNHYDYIEECLISILTQAGVAIEVICVDDCSTDSRTSEVLRRLKDRHPNFRIVLNEENKGISRTQNEAVEGARGQYVAFVDCDDALVPNALAKVVALLNDDPGIDYVFTDRLDVDEAGAAVRRADYGGYAAIKFSNTGQITSDLLDGMVASHLKVIRRSTYLEAGGSDDAFSGIQDWELALKIAEFGSFRYLHEALYRHRVHQGSVTRSDSVAQFRKTNIVRRRFSERWLRNGKACEGGSIRFFGTSGNLPTVKELKEAWNNGRRCEFVIGAQVPAPVLNFVREFNSYFDRIVWESPEAYAGLIGYLWSDILVGPTDTLVGEL